MKKKIFHGHNIVNINAPPKNKTVLVIPRPQILEDPHNLREKFDDHKIRELARSIKNQGMQQLPEVNFGHKRDGVTYYYLKSGARRLRAHDILKKEEVECVVLCEQYNGERNVERRLEQGAENSSREGQTHSELVRLVEEVIEVEVRNQDAPAHGAIKRALHRVASAFGKSDMWAQNYHTLAGLLPELREMLDEDEEGERLNFNVGLALARAPQDAQRALLEEARSHFQRGGHQSGYSFIVRKAREIRVERGEKVRGRAFDEKTAFMKIADRLLDLAAGFGGGRTGERYTEWIHTNLARMKVEEVDRMLSTLISVVDHFSQLKDMVNTRRDENYTHFRMRRVK